MANEERQKLPEFAPLRNYNKQFMFEVRVYDENDTCIRTEVMDYGNADDRQWLGKISFYYWNIGCTIETFKQQ
jgi:hypothetical protein